MDNCTLCRSRKADKKGSHYIPHFLIASAFSSDGSNARDKEVSFLLGESIGNLYIGRRVLPEEISEVLGRDLTENELDKNVSHQTRDNFLCIQCEERFSKLESYYSKSQENLTERGLTAEYPISGALSMLFWVSVIWRWSVIRDGGFSMKPKDEEKLRKALDACLGGSEEELIRNTISSIHLLSDMQYCLILEQGERPPSERLVTAHPKHKMPYCFIINKNILFFYISKRHTNVIKQSFFGYDKELETLEGVSFNTTLSKFQTAKLISAEKSKQYQSGAVNYKANQFIDKLKLYVYRVMDLLFKEHLGLAKAPDKEKEQVFKEFIDGLSSNVHMASDKDLRYSEERKRLILYDVLAKRMNQGQ